MMASLPTREGRVSSTITEHPQGKNWFPPEKIEGAPKKYNKRTKVKEEYVSDKQMPHQNVTRKMDHLLFSARTVGRKTHRHDPTKSKKCKRRPGSTLISVTPKPRLERKARFYVAR